MADVSVIGSTSRVHGRITGPVDLEIQGFVEGEVAVDGDVVVEARALVAASIQARSIVVRGAIRGDLTVEEAVILEDGARVVGDVRAQRVVIAPGAFLRGHVQTAGVDTPRPVARGQTASRTARAPEALRPAMLPPRPAATPRPIERPAVVRAPVAQAPTRTLEETRPAMKTEVLRPSPVPKQAPPAPVVPALKKGTKGTFKKKM